MLEQSHEKNKDLNTLFFSYLSPSMTSNIEKNYSLGVELTKKWNYSLLACLFYKHKGEYYFNNGDYGKAFTEYAKWINISQKNIRPQERYRSFAEINEKLIELDEKKMQKYFQILEDKCEEKVELFSDEFYRSVKK